MPLILQVGLALWMSAVIVAAFLWVPPARGFAAPEAARIVLFHVPCAMMAVLAYVVSTVYAIAYLVRSNPGADARSAASAGLGLLFTILATVTGMVFAQVQWGSAWNWDPRETTILVLLIIYCAYFALRSAVPGSVTRGQVSAAYNILAGLVMPFLVFVLPRVMGGLHPTDTLSSRTGLSSQYRIVMACAGAAFAWLYIWLLRIRVRVWELETDRRRARGA